MSIVIYKIIGENAMFTELLNKKIYITDTLYLRYDIKAFIEAEEKGISPFELTFPLPLDYIRAGLRCCFDELGADPVKRSEIVAYMIKELSQEYLQDRVLAATTAAQAIYAVNLTVRCSSVTAHRQA